MSNLWLLVSLVVVQCVSCLKIIPQEPEYIVTLNSTETDPYGSFILTCTDTENITWTFSKKEDTVYTLEYHQQNGLHMLILNVSNISYLDTGNYVCRRQLQKTRNDRAEIYVYLFDNLHFLAVKDDFAVLQSSENKSIIIPCKPTLPNITVILYNTEDDNEMNLPFDPKKGFTLDMPTVKDSKYVRCEGTNNSSEPADETNQKVFHLLISTSSMSARPFISPSGTLPPVEGKPLSLNCSVQLSIGSTVFVNWKYPNEGSKNRSTELSQQEFIHSDGGKVNYRILTFFNLSKSDTGNYTCEIEDTHSDDSVNSYAYYLNVFDPKESFLDFKILTDMTNHTQKTGFPKIQWMLNVTSHPAAKVSCKVPNGLVVSSTDSSSMTKYQLTVVDKLVKFAVLNLDVNDTGIYEFTADNGPEKKTVNISIFIEDKPEIQMAKKNESSLVNQVSEVECSVIGYPLPKITWFALKCNNYPTCEQYVSTELTSNNFKIDNDIKRPHMITSTLHYRANETTMLTCSASNSIGSNSSSIPFFVSDVINGFNVSVSSYEITVDDNVSITCQASKYIYKNNIIWHHSPDGLKYDRVENSRNVQISYSVTKFSYKSVINITGIQKSHGGVYQCSVNSIERRSAEVESVEIKVNDVEYPFIDSTNLNGSSITIDAIKGKHAFYCYARGVPKPTLTWYKDQRPLVIRKNDTDNLSLSPDNRTLTIKFPQAEHAGEYKCEAKNKVGNVVRRGFLVVKGLPDEHHHFYYIILPAILTISLTTCIAWILVKMQKMKKLKKKLAEDGLLNFDSGAVNSLNPELGIEEQADLLPYDSRWEFPREKLKLGKQLGAGAFGVVLKAEADGIIDPNTSTTVAVKMVKRNVDALYIRALASELKIMIHLGRHLNVVNLLGACTRDINKRELVVIVEYCKYGNLHDFLLKQRGNFINQINDSGQLDFSIQENKNGIRFSTSGAVVNTSYTGTTTVESVTTEETLIGSDGYLINKDVEPDWRSNYRGDYRNTIVRPIKTSDLLCWSFQIARGMEYLASRKVLHGDLAARNVLLADDNIVKICDFGLAKSMYASDNYKRKKNELLPVRWMAVESIRDRVFSIQSDVWSFGITMWELFSLSVTPYPGVEHLEALYTKLESGYRLDKPTYATKEIHEIMIDCWHERPTMRPLFTDLSERIGALLENGVRSHYTNLNEVYLQMNANTCNGVDYLSLLNPPVYTTVSEEPRYVNLPSITSRESPEPEDDVELKPMLNTSDNYINAKPLLFSNPNYMEINRPKIPTYVNST